ncbi:hypothetical protein D3C83_319850 [compost metagenome]
MKDPRSGPTVRMAIHHAAGVARPSLAICRITASAKPTMGRVAASAMMTTTNIGSV